MKGSEQLVFSETVMPDDRTSRSLLEICLLNNYQRNFPLKSRPFDEIARELDCSPSEILKTLRKLQEEGAISRIGPVLRPNSVNSSILGAMHVPEDRLLEVAGIINSYDEVNHNYEREHHFNLWFVIHGQDETHVHRVLDEIEERSGRTVIRLPILDAYHIDLGFDLRC